MSNVEQAKKMLESDLDSYPAVVKDPIGDARTYCKIQRYIYACISDGVSKANCVDWLYDLYKEQNEEEKHHFTLELDLVAKALYDYHNYLSIEQ